jgi:transglutaminase-like putative cysteine protease
MKPSASFPSRNLSMVCPLVLAAALSAGAAHGADPAGAAAPAAAHAPFTLVDQVLHGEREPVQVSAGAGAGYYRHPPPNGFADPIEPLSEDDRKLLGKPFAPKDLKAFTDGYVDRIEAYYAARANPAPDFSAWLKAHPEIRREFWLAISPQFDDAAGAIGVLDTLRKRSPKAVEKFFHLAIATAVVYDSPDAALTDRFEYLWAVSAKQFSPQRSYTEIFDYLTAERNQARLVFHLNELPWPVLVHLVDLDVSDREIEWALATCDSAKHDLGALYQTVPYDDDKLGRRTPKLGDRDYTLDNLLKYGGVCVDQAHYTSRVAKCFGVPAMKVAGEGRYGATSLHSWAGFLVNSGGRPLLQFTGRYDFDYYYTGTIFDPQTRTVILDREIEMLYDGVSQSYAKFESSQLLARAAIKLANANGATALALAQQAIDLNSCSPNAWRLLAYGAANGLIERKEGNKLVARMMKELAGHPDLTLECLDSFMAVIPLAQVAERQEVFNRANALYAKRPDLQIRLRLAQCAELQEAHREVDAIQTALATAIANAKEGSLILPLVKQIVGIAKDFAATSKGFQIGVVRQALAKVEKDFPKARGATVSEAYTEFQGMVQGLAAAGP